MVQPHPHPKSNRLHRTTSPAVRPAPVHPPPLKRSTLQSASLVQGLVRWPRDDAAWPVAVHVVGRAVVTRVCPVRGVAVAQEPPVDVRLGPGVAVVPVAVVTSRAVAVGRAATVALGRVVGRPGRAVPDPGHGPGANPVQGPVLDLVLGPVLALGHDLCPGLGHAPDPAVVRGHAVSVAVVRGRAVAAAVALGPGLHRR